jgi:hypothetical protein
VYIRETVYDLLFALVTALNFGLEASLDNMFDWRGIRWKALDVSCTKVYVTDDETFR